MLFRSTSYTGTWKAGQAIGNDPAGGVDLGFELRLNGVPREGDKINLQKSDAVVATNNGNAKAFLKLRAAAYRAYFEHLPLSPKRMPHGAQMRMHDRFEWGQLADLWLIDGRQFRDPPTCSGWHLAAHGNVIWRCPSLDAPERSVLGREQEDWLAAGLASSAKAWKLIEQPTQPASVARSASRP